MYYLEIWATRLVVLLLTRFSLRGKENVPREGPLLVVANHLSVADPPILGAHLGRRTVFMAKEELFRNWLSRYFISQFGAIPVYRGRSNRDAIRQAGRLFEQGKVLAMFPEGKRSREGHLQPALPGSALIAVHNNVLILPVGITGTESIRGLSWIWRRPRINFNIGRPFVLPREGNIVNKERLAEYTDVIMKQIAALLPDNYRGEY